MTLICFVLGASVAFVFVATVYPSWVYVCAILTVVAFILFCVFSIATNSVLNTRAAGSGIANVHANKETAHNPELEAALEAARQNNLDLAAACLQEANLLATYKTAMKRADRQEARAVEADATVASLRADLNSAHQRAAEAEDTLIAAVARADAQKARANEASATAERLGEELNASCQRAADAEVSYAAEKTRTHDLEERGTKARAEAERLLDKLNAARQREANTKAMLDEERARANRLDERSNKASDEARRLRTELATSRQREADIVNMLNEEKVRTHRQAGKIQMLELALEGARIHQLLLEEQAAAAAAALAAAQQTCTVGSSSRSIPNDLPPSPYGANGYGAANEFTSHLPLPPGINGYLNGYGAKIATGFSVPLPAEFASMPPGMDGYGYDCAYNADAAHGFIAPLPAEFASNPPLPPDYNTGRIIELPDDSSANVPEKASKCNPDYRLDHSTELFLDDSPAEMPLEASKFKFDDRACKNASKVTTSFYSDMETPRRGTDSPRGKLPLVFGTFSGNFYGSSMAQGPSASGFTGGVFRGVEPSLGSSAGSETTLSFGDGLHAVGSNRIFGPLHLENIPSNAGHQHTTSCARKTAAARGRRTAKRGRK